MKLFDCCHPDAIHRYLEFFHAVPVANFDVAEMRRKMGFVRIPDLDCAEDVQIRLNTYQHALNQLESFFTDNDNGVGILDVALTTHELRSMVKMRVSSPEY
jgi:4-hydroxyphenylpyruvate dioxygenase-like putative hemolysin